MTGRRRCALLLLLAGLSQPVAANPNAPALDPVLDEWLPARLHELDVPGAALVVVSEGQVLALRGFGSVDPVAGTPVDPVRHLFRIGSVSKSLTATVVLRLARARGIDLHDDLRPRLAALPIRPPLERPLTLHHLLSHTAGFDERLFGQHVASPAALTDLSGYLQAHLPPRFAAPGEVIAYNDHHTVLAAWLAERIGGAPAGERGSDVVAGPAGEPFAALAERLLFGPLGMSRTTFRQTGPAAAAETVVTAAWQRSGSAWTAYPPDYVVTAPAAGAFSTAADMGRYAQALLACRGPVVDRGLCATQLRRQAGHHPRLPGRAYGFAEGRHGGDRVLYKDGQASGFNARLLLVPERGIGIFVVHNRSVLGPFGAFHAAAALNRETTAAVLDALLPASEPPLIAPVAAPDAARRTQSYAGDYRNVVAARHTWERVVGMFDDVHVVATPRGVDLGGGEFVEIAPGLAQWHAGGERFVAFRQAGERGASHLFIGSGAYERIPWFTASWFTPWLIAGTGLWLLGASCLAGRGLRGWPRLLAVLGPGALLAFVGAFAGVMAVTDPQVLFRGPPPGLLVALALPLAGCVALAGHVVWLAAGGWRRAGVAGRLLTPVNLLVCGAFLWWLAYWNLLGYRLG